MSRRRRTPDFAPWPSSSPPAPAYHPAPEVPDVDPLVLLAVMDEVLRRGTYPAVTDLARATGQPRDVVRRALVVLEHQIPTLPSIARGQG